MPVLEDLWTLLGAVLAGAIAGGWLAWIATGKLRSLRARDRSVSGNQAEEIAAELLEAEGYRILDHPFSLEWTYWIDGEEQTSALRADFRVERDGITSLVEVKSTRRAGVATLPETRRQLLEYSRAFRGPVLLLCTATETLVNVTFEEDCEAELTPGNEGRRSAWARWFGVGAGWLR